MCIMRDVHMHSNGNLLGKEKSLFALMFDNV